MELTCSSFFLNSSAFRLYSSWSFSARCCCKSNLFATTSGSKIRFTLQRYWIVGGSLTFVVFRTVFLFFLFLFIFLYVRFEPFVYVKEGNSAEEYVPTIVFENSS